MSPIRPLRPEDIPTLVSLRGRCFARSAQQSPDGLLRYFETIFLQSPLLDPTLPSLVCEDQAGSIIGFIGVLTRQLLFRGEPVRLAVSTQLMVEPGARGMPGIELLRAYYGAGQDLSFADASTSTARSLWDRLGGKTCLLQSLSWLRPLRPWRYAVGQRVHGPVGRVAALGLRPLLELADRRAAANPRDPLGLIPPTASPAPFEAERILPLLDRMEGRPSLRPVYHPAGLTWVLARAAERAASPVHSCLAVGADGTVIGWYVFEANRGGVGDVIHMGAVRDHAGAVLDLLFADAARHGLVALRGRLEPLWLPALLARRASVIHGGAWSLIHTRRPELAAAVLAGDAMLTRLEGETWLNF